MPVPPRARRALSRTGLIAAAAAALVGGVLAVPAAATPSAANPYSPAYGHPYRHGAVPTIETQRKMDTWATGNAVAPRNSANNLVFAGGIDGIGVTIGVPKVYLVFWGSGWGTQGTDANGNLTFGNDPSAGAPKLQNMFKGLGTGGELWSGIATQYCEGVAAGTQICGGSGTHVGMPTAGVLAGVWYDNSAVALTTTANQIGNEAIAAAGHFGNTTPALNRSAQYVILSATGYHPDSFNSPLQWCAWHDWNGDPYVGSTSPYGDIAFSNMPYVMDAGASCGANFVNAGTAGATDGYTIVEGHEYMETITDQNPAGGYTDSAGAENGDKCAWVSPGVQGGAGNVAMGNGTYPEQGGWSNDSLGGTGQCEIAHPVVVGGGPTVANPGNQAGTVGVAASLALSASGGSSPYTWSATGLPAGLSINSSTGVISGTPTTVNTYTVTVTATDSQNRPGSAQFGWTVNPSGSGGCVGTNPNDVAIPDLTTVQSPIGITGCAGNASATSTVEVHIVHTYTGDLVVSLIAPDGTAYVLQNRVGGATQNIDTTYTVDLSSEVANGTWNLQVQDAAAIDTGYINSWTLTLGGGGGGGSCTGTNGTNTTIPDRGTASSPIVLAGCTGNASATSTVEVHIVHTRQADLVVTLVAPDGSTYVLQSQTGSGANINTTYTVNLSSEVRNGTWNLRVSDNRRRNTGYIDSWTLTL